MTTAAATALLIYLLSLAGAFGWRTLMHRRATGSSGYHRISGRPGTAAWWSGPLFLLALLLGALAPVLVLLHAAGPVFWHPATAVIGAVIAVGGIVLTLTAQHQMGRSWRIGIDPQQHTDLVTNGLFAHIRNPIFTGMLTVAAGTTVMIPNLVAVLALACLATAVHLQVRAVEEPHLLASHPATYPPYAARTGRFLPGFGRLHPGDHSG